MIRSDYLVRATKFMNEFAPYLKGQKKIEDVEFAVSQFNLDKKRKVIFRRGATRYALITSDYVIKWDYDPRWVRKFGGCKEELRIYNKAVKGGYDYLFAAITPIKVGRHVFYVMPRVKNVGKRFHHQTGLWGYLTEEEENYVYRKLGLNDLHHNNWGLRDGKPVIIDYACT